MTEKLILQALHGQRPPRLPIWMMRQAGRYLPEYRATRAKAGDFLSLCYTPDLAAEVTLQPIRRFGFDGAILFADILLIAQALGPKLWFAEGEGPRLSPVQNAADVATLRPSADVHETLAPVYETLRILRRALPAETTLIGFAGAPWTVASYMIAGRGVPGQGPAHDFKAADRAAFTALIDRLSEASIEYLSAQAEAGAEVLKIFDSWAGSLQGADFDDFAVKPTARIIAALKARHPSVPVIAFPRGAGARYEGFAAATGAAGLALDQEVSAEWAARVLQPKVCVQGNLAPELLVQGGPALVTETRRIAEALKGGPHIFNLGHGITPEAPIAHVETMIETLRAWEKGA